MGFARVVWTITRRVFILIILMLAFIGSAVTAIYFSRGKEVRVPKLVGKPQSDAKRIASAAGLQVDIIEIFDENAPPDSIVRQEPKAGIAVRQGYTVKVYFSRNGKKSSVSLNNQNQKLEPIESKELEKPKEPEEPKKPKEPKKSKLTSEIEQ